MWDWGPKRSCPEAQFTRLDQVAARAKAVSSADQAVARGERVDSDSVAGDLAVLLSYHQAC